MKRALALYDDSIVKMLLCVRECLLTSLLPWIRGNSTSTFSDAIFRVGVTVTFWIDE